MPRKPGRMAGLGDEAFKQTDNELAENEANLLLQTSVDWEALRPQVNDPEIYDQLIAAVNEATQRNESVAQLNTRLQQLGKEGFNLAQKVVASIP
jgi:hypothetical protein